MFITFAIVTVSDTCYQKINEDRSGLALEKSILESFPDAKIFAKTIVPDEIDRIETELLELCIKNCNVILTTGGTGFSKRDVTPEATKRVIKKEAPGISYAMISKSLQITNMAMLSRAVSGIRDQTLIINLPGSIKGATECFEFVKPSIPHAIQLLIDNKVEIKRLHEEIQASTPSQVLVNQVSMRNRHSPYEMLEVEDALKLVLDNCKSTNETKLIKIEESLNRILAEDICTSEPFPLFRASIKDGYAVKAADGTGIRVVNDAMAAGDNPESNQLKPGEVIRINTGAAVPAGADAVVQVEDTELVEADDSFKEITIKINIAPTVGQDIRDIGSDIQAGELVLNKFSKLKASHIGVLAMVGRTKVTVFKRPSIGILSTGNELQKHDEELKPGHIRDSNKLTLLNLLIEHGYKGHDCGIAKDEPNYVKQAFEKILTNHDVVITTGGVSMGEFDLIKEVLQKDFDATIHFGRLNMKPGKPTTFSTCIYKNRKKYFFSLPGNPVSATVTNNLFVIPALHSLENHKPYLLPHLFVIMGEDIKLDIRPEYRRIRLERKEDAINTLVGYTTGNQISSRLNSFVGAHALALMPSFENYKTTILEKGMPVKAMIIDFNI